MVNIKVHQLHVASMARYSEQGGVETAYGEHRELHVSRHGGALGE